MASSPRFAMIIIFYMLIIAPMMSFGLSSATAIDYSEETPDLLIKQVTNHDLQNKMLSQPHQQFSMFMKKFGKTYASKEEHDHRFSVFKSNIMRALRHQRRDPSAFHGVTQFSDLTTEEFHNLFLGGGGQSHGLPDNNKAPILQTSDLPREFHYDFTTPIKNQQLVVPVSSDENQMAANLVKNGPLGVGFNADYMQTYTGGISCPRICSKKPNHAALIVGYAINTRYIGLRDNIPYWIINNNNLAANEYKLCRGHNVCGVESMVSTVPAALSTTSH